MGIPKKPIIPAVTNKGKILGMSEMRIILKDLNMYAIKRAINEIARESDRIKFLIRYLVPFKKIKDFPVS
jgi:hypothetical protein